MYIIVQHKISDPKRFWEAVEAGMPKLPAHLKVRSVFPDGEGSRAVYLWEAETLSAVQDFVEETVGPVSQNRYFAVDASKAVGLPGTAQPA